MLIAPVKTQRDSRSWPKTRISQTAQNSNQPRKVGCYGNGVEPNCFKFVRRSRHLANTENNRARDVSQSGETPASGQHEAAQRKKCEFVAEDTRHLACIPARAISGEQALQSNKGIGALGESARWRAGTSGGFAQSLSMQSDGCTWLAAQAVAWDERSERQHADVVCSK